MIQRMLKARLIGFMLAAFAVAVAISPNVAMAGRIGTEDTPTVELLLNGQAIDLLYSVSTTETGIFVFDIPRQTGAGYVIEQSSGAANPDPFIIYAVGGINASAVDQTFNFIFTTPIVPGAYNFVSSSFSLTGTSGDANGITISAISQVSTASPPLTNLGVDLSLPDQTFGGSGSFQFGTDSATNSFGPIGTFTTLTLSVSITITPGDAFSLDGATVLSILNPVPEPASLTLLGAGLVGLVGFRRRKVA